MRGFRHFSAILCSLLLYAAPGKAQRLQPEPYNREFSFGVMAQPRGIGFDFRFGKFTGANRVQYLEMEFLTIRHPKEIRIYNTRISNPSPYTYGKLNYAYCMRLGYGNKFVLAQKRLKNTVSVSLSTAIGPNFTVLKPVYLDYLVQGPDQDYIYSQKVSDGEHINQDNVVGNAPFSKGLNELQLRVGAFAKAGFNFDWGDFADEIQALEVGVYVDAFPQRLPLMLYTQNKYVYPSFYICAIIGNKW